MVEIQEALTDYPKGFNVVMPARKFVREGLLIKVNVRGKQQERQFFLFNDIIMYCKEQLFKKATYEYKGVIPLDCCLVNDLPDTEELQHAIQLVRLDNKRKYTLSALTSTDKKQWISDLSKIIDVYLNMEQKRTSKNSLK